MRQVAWVVVIGLVGSGCGGFRQRGATAPTPSTAEQFAAGGASSVPAAPQAAGYPMPSAEVDAAESESIAITTSSSSLVGGGPTAPPPPPPPPPRTAEVAAGQGVSTVAGAAPATQAGLPEQLVVEGWFGVEVDDVRATAIAIREQVAALGGRVVADNIGSSGGGWSGNMEIRVPPATAHGFAGWLETHADVRSRRLLGTDVSRTLFDQQIELDNHQLTLKRLQQLLDRPNIDMKDVLSIEAELTRIRGAIERVKGEQRYLRDRVAMATIHISLSRPPEPPAIVLGAPNTKLYPGPRMAALVLLTPGDRERVRFGGGVTIGLGHPRVSAELDVFESAGDQDAGVIATLGGAVYSDHFGRGRRRFLNPYLGLRVGYAHVGQSAFVAGGEIGVELFKHRYLLVDANVRVVSLLGSDADAAAIGGLSIVLAF